MGIEQGRSLNAGMLGWRDTADWCSCRKKAQTTFDYGCWPWMMRQRGEATVAAVEVVVVVVAVVVVKDAEHRRTGTRCIHDESGEPVSGLERIVEFESRSCWRVARRPYTRE